MRLRYFRVQNYPPIRDISLSAESPLQRECAIRFVVGVNGTGKTHLLLTETFIALARQKPPHFPVTLIYELGYGKTRRTLIFDNPGNDQDEGWWQSAPERPLLPHDFRKSDWHPIIEQARQGASDWEALIQDGSAWPGERVGIPKIVLVYTTGSPDPWTDLFRREPPAEDVDIISQSPNYDTGTERPAGWSRSQEIHYQRQLGDEGVARSLQNLEQEAGGGGENPDQDVCLFITPTILKFALLSVSLPLAMKELREFETDQDIAAFIARIREMPDAEQGLRRLLSQIGWVWPVSLSFSVDFQPDEWSKSRSRLMRELFEISTTVIREPEPSFRRRVFFDLNAENSDKYAGDTLLKFLGGPGSDPFDYFKKLLSLHHQGLMEDMQIAVRNTDSDEILLFDELSDGEQVYLGRMALFHLMEGHHDALILLDEPETHFNDKWKREIVDIIDQVLGESCNHVLISTHSGICLTDVFTPEITLLEKGRDGNVHEEKLEDVHTFGATPDHPMRDVFGTPGTVGKRASSILDILLAAESDREIVEAIWAMPYDPDDPTYRKLLEHFSANVREQCEDRFYDKKRIGQILNSIRGFAKNGNSDQPLTVLEAMDALVGQVGPGHYPFDLYRSIYRLSEESSDDVT